MLSEWRWLLETELLKMGSGMTPNLSWFYCCLVSVLIFTL